MVHHNNPKQLDTTCNLNAACDMTGGLMKNKMSYAPEHLAVCTLWFSADGVVPLVAV